MKTAGSASIGTFPAIVDAESAAELAIHTATMSCEWAAAAGVGADDAAEAMHAAWRATQAAERARRAGSLEDAWQEAAAAWAAVTTVLEADARVVAALVAALVAA
jgi:hypothetical protein